MGALVGICYLCCYYFHILQRYIAYKQRKQRLEHELYLKQIEKDKSEEFNRELQTFLRKWRMNLGLR